MFLSGDVVVNRVHSPAVCRLSLLMFLLLDLGSASLAADDSAVARDRVRLRALIANSKSPRARISAARKLHSIADNVKPAVAALADILATKGLKTELYVTTLKAIALYGPEAKSAVPSLLQRLKDPEPKIRIHTVMALQAIGPEAKAAAPELIKRLDDLGTMDVKYHPFGRSQPTDVPSEPVRVYAMQALAAMGLEARAAIPKLKAAISKSQNEFVAADALLKIAPSEAEVVFIGLLTDKNDNSKYVAFHGLRGRRTQRTIAELLKLVGDPASKSAGDALALLEQFGKLDTASAVLALKNPHETTGAFNCGFVYSTPIRQLATGALARAGSRGHAALIRGLKNSGDNELRVRAAECLLEIGPHADDVLPTLVDVLKLSKDTTIVDNVPFEKRTTIKSIALNALSQLGPKAKSALPVLRLLLEQKSLRLQVASTIDAIAPGDAAAVAVLKPKADALLQMLIEDTDVFAMGRPEYEEQFVELGTPAVPGLIKLIENKDEDKAGIALGALGKLTRRSAAARNAIVAKAKSAIKKRDPQNTELMTAVSGLPSRVAVPLLTRLIVATQDFGRVEETQSVLTELGPEGIRIARKLSKDPAELVREVGSTTLSDLVFIDEVSLRGNGEMIRELFSIVNDPAEPIDLRGEVAAVLAKLQPDPKLAVPAIIKIIKTQHRDPQQDVSESLVRALIPFGAHAQSAVPLLIELFEYRDQSYRTAVLEALAVIGPAAKPALPKLIASFQPGDVHVPPDDALAAIRDSVPVSLRPILKSKHAEMRMRAARILARIGPASTPVAGELRDLAANDPRSIVRVVAVEALGHIGAKDASAKHNVETLRQALGDDSLAVRANAATALGRLGRIAKPARARLLQSLKSDFATMKHAAIQAITAIDATHSPNK